MVPIVDADDLPASVSSAVESDLLQTMLAAANAKALRVAPCLDETPTGDQLAEAKLVLVGAITRWSQAGAGGVTQQTAGPFAQTLNTSQPMSYNLWPSDIDQLAVICSGSTGRGGAFTVDLVPAPEADDLASRPDLWFQWVQPVPPNAP